VAVAAVASPEEEAPVGGLAETLLGTIQTALLSDPSDYTVAADNTIEVHPLETLGHYGDWLEIKTQRLRDLNGLAFRTPVDVGQRIRLDLGTVDANKFEERRIAYHRKQQDAFFRQHVIKETVAHTISRGESVWVVALRKYDVPLWLFRQYNPEVDLHNVQPGTTVQIPVLVDAAG
jgi:membrane-bound lytic murein transglycosylase D